MATATLDLPDDTDIRVGKWGHWTTVKNRNLVTVHHTKNCEIPCEDTKKILEYLEAELFVEKGSYVVSETTK